MFFVPFGVQMWTSVMGTIAASMAARTCWGATAVVAPRATSSTTNGTSVWVSGTEACWSGLPEPGAMESGNEDQELNSRVRS